MTYREPQIALYLLLGILLVPHPALAAQQPVDGWSTVSPETPLPNGNANANANAHSHTSQAPHESEIMYEPAPTSSKYFSTQWRNWSEPGHGGEFPGYARPAPYVDICSDCPDHYPWYFESGLIALQRDRWEGGSFITKPGVTVFNREDLQSRVEWGGRLTAGTRCWNCTELEFTGFMMGDLNLATSGRGPFNVNLPVFNPPFGFDDFANNVTLINLHYSTELAGFEVVCRKWDLVGCCDDPCCGTSCSGAARFVAIGLECGLRYLNIDEEFNVYSQFGPQPGIGGFQDFNYDTSADNHIWGPEIGIQLRSCPWLCFDLMFSSRFTLAANFIDTEVSLRERTGQVAFFSDRNEVSCTQVLDTSAYLRMRLGNCIDVRVGYQLLWVNGYAGASDQFSNDLSRAGQFDDNNGILFQGPAMLVQINF